MYNTSSDEVTQLDTDLFVSFPIPL